MATRSAGVNAFWGAIKRFRLDIERIRAFDRFSTRSAVGPTSLPCAPPGCVSGGIFPDFTLEVFEERHHFDSPHRAEPQRYARSLRKLWDRARVAS